jgi:RNA polymerase sigma-70 factor (ECF subfamily)
MSADIADDLTAGELDDVSPAGAGPTGGGSLAGADPTHNGSPVGVGAIDGGSPVGAGATEGGSAVGVEPTDGELARRIGREPELFRVVHNRYHGDLYRYVAGRLDRQTAEDIVSETFLTAFTRRHRFDPDRGSLRPWLFGIATNLVNRHRRKEARRYRTLSRVPPEPAAEGPENRVLDAVAAGRLQPRLARALTRLSAGERDVLLLVALAGLSYEEVAEALGISAGTTGSRLSRARGKLRTVLDREALDG